MLDHMVGVRLTFPAAASGLPRVAVHCSIPASSASALLCRVCVCVCVQISLIEVQLIYKVLLVLGIQRDDPTFADYTLL